MKCAPALADHSHRTVPKVYEQLAEILSGFVPSAKRDLQFGARLGLEIALGSLVRDEVARADTADAQRFVRSSEIAVRGIEIVVRFDAALAFDLPHGAERLFQRCNIDAAEFLF